MAAKPKVLVMSGYGINCETETAHAFKLVGGLPEIVHINDLIAGKRKFGEYDIIAFPGGFSYGDDTGAGLAFANKLKNNLWKELHAFILDQKLILGICNGFQIMTQLGLFGLTERDYGHRISSLMSNTTNRYECRWVTLKSTSKKCIFTKGINVTEVPVAHGEGRFHCDKKTYERLQSNDQIVFQYSTRAGNPAKGDFPTNPNGSFADIAAICDCTGRIMGMMPHPERAIFQVSHPEFHVLQDKARRSGKKLPTYLESNLTIFRNAVLHIDPNAVPLYDSGAEDEPDSAEEVSERPAVEISPSPSKSETNSHSNTKHVTAKATTSPPQKAVEVEEKSNKIQEGQEMSTTKDANEAEYKKLIRANLDNTIEHGFIPELGIHKSGKVRDIHFTKLEVGKPIVMVASDRVSAFDHILDRTIPFKGMVLNLLNRWAMVNTKDIVPNASQPSPHPSVLVQDYCDNVMVECVVRGYVWGSMAADYESGKRVFCGINLPENLLRYQKLDEPLFTPTTKDTKHDEPMTFEEVEAKLGKDIAKKVKATALALYERGHALAKKRGLLFIDTKYEFGLDKKGDIYLIDEANTPDSSRYCSIDQYEKFTKISSLMKSGSYDNVSQVLKKNPELKIEELSKQFVRDVLTEKGFSYGSDGEIPKLTDDEVIEVSYRYIKLYETLTGKKFPFRSSNLRMDLISKLAQKGYIKGGLCVIMAGSDSDLPHIEKIQAELDKFGVPSHVRICSAHKQPAQLEGELIKYNQSLEPIVIIGVAGGTDALSGTASFHSVHPVVSCPPKREEFESCIKNPPGSSNSTVLRPENAARHVAQILGHFNPTIQKVILEGNEAKINKLKTADRSLRGTKEKS